MKFHEVNYTSFFSDWLLRFLTSLDSPPLISKPDEPVYILPAADWKTLCSDRFRRLVLEASIEGPCLNDSSGNLIVSRAGACVWSRLWGVGYVDEPCFVLWVSDHWEIIDDLLDVIEIQRVTKEPNRSHQRCHCGDNSNNNYSYRVVFVSSEGRAYTQYEHHNCQEPSPVHSDLYAVVSVFRQRTVCRCSRHISYRKVLLGFTRGRREWQTSATGWIPNWLGFFDIGWSNRATVRQ